LFQFVNAPPLQPRPRLPASVRGSLADRIDPRLAVIMALSVIAHVIVMSVAWTHDQTVQSRVARIHREFQEDSFRERTATIDVTPPVTEAEVEAEVPSEATSPDPRPSSTASPDRGDGGRDEPGDGGAPSDAQIEEAISGTALVGLLTGGESPGGRYGEMSETDQGAGLDKGLENARGKDVVVLGGRGVGGHRGGGTGRIGTDKEGVRGKVSGPGQGGSVGPKTEEAVSRVKLLDVEEVGDGTLDPDSVYRTIQSRYLNGIKRCHQRVLKNNPEAGGRVEVRFTVGPTGGVTKATVRGFSPEVDSCIRALATKWRFGAPKDDDGKPATADFQFPFILR